MARIEALTTRGPVGAVRRLTHDITQSAKDAFEPLLALHGFGNIHPHELTAVLVDWHLPAISGTSNFLDMLEIISPEAYDVEIKQQRASGVLLLKDYDEPTGGFRDFRATKRFPEAHPVPTLYATEHAVNIAKHLVGVRDGQPFGYAKAAVFFGQDKTDRVVEFVKKSQDQNGGFYHSSEPTSIFASVWNTELILSILRDLGQEDRDVIENAREFLLAKCFVTNQDKCGFSNHPADEPYHQYIGHQRYRSSEATASALRILTMMGERQWIQEHRQGLITYLKSCWGVDKKGIEGFSHVPGSKPALLYTNAILSSADNLEADVDDLLPNSESRQKLIQLYTKHCQSREKGKLLFGFAPGLSPNSPIMKDTMATLQHLAERHQDFEALFAEIFLTDSVTTVQSIYEFLATPEYLRWLGY